MISSVSLISLTVNLVKRPVNARHGAGRCNGIVRAFLHAEEWPLDLDFFSENTPQGQKKTQLAQTLLNGNNICMVGTTLDARWEGTLTGRAADTW